MTATLSVETPIPVEAFQASFIAALRHMVSSRVLEEKLASLYRAGGRIVGGVYLGKGQEAYSAALGIQLVKGRDIYSGLIRDQAGKMAFGEPILDATRTYLGSALGPMRGRDGNIHRGRPKEGMPAMISHLGSMVSVVSGMLIGRRQQGRLGDSVGATCIGDGGTSTGAFHEGLNMAAVERLPLIVAVANNQYAYSTPNDRQFACENLVDRAKGYGVEGYEVDGKDLLACLQVFQHAVARARAGHGPQMIVGALLRLGGHGEHDDASYIPDTVKHSEHGRDCLQLAEQDGLARGWITQNELDTLREQSQKEVDRALAQTSREPTPDPYKESWRALSTSALVEEEQ
ncbi:MAG: thiamine pyrophosphate-dependent dehydrogenase E1 component subunit alpha [Verrucomicrobium sp.]|nr:thiamine pyrophosphate-dependent dehydrogenase E1 component subunit alpha [Verrucomicrobium sp.]